MPPYIRLRRRAGLRIDVHPQDVLRAEQGGGHREHAAAAAEVEDRVAGHHVLRQVLVGDSDRLRAAAPRIERGIERKGRTFAQLHRAIAKTFYADLRSRKVEQHPDAAICPLRGCSGRFGICRPMISRSTLSLRS